MTMNIFEQTLHHILQLTYILIIGKHCFFLMFGHTWVTVPVWSLPCQSLRCHTCFICHLIIMLCSEIGKIKKWKMKWLKYFLHLKQQRKLVLYGTTNCHCMAATVSWWKSRRFLIWKTGTRQKSWSYPCRKWGAQKWDIIEAVLSGVIDVWGAQCIGLEGVCVAVAKIVPQFTTDVKSDAKAICTASGGLRGVAGVRGGSPIRLHRRENWFVCREPRITYADQVRSDIDRCILRHRLA